MGSPRAHDVDAGSFKVTEAWFPSGLELSPHRHMRTTFGIMLDGSFDLFFGGKHFDCTPSTVFTEPLGDRHGNRIGSKGAHVLVVQPDHEQEELFRSCRPIFEQITHFEHGGITSLAWRLVREVRTSDTATPLALQGLGFEMLATAARMALPTRSAPPAWLRRVEDMLRSLFLEGVSVEDLAREIDVHPMYLARMFRKHYRESVGAFVRRLRLDWAVRQLATTDESLAQIALRAGFADQSHFTRAFKRYTGFPPGRYRNMIKE